MKVLIDTNIVIDYLADRMPFADQAEEIMKLCATRKITGVLTASSFTDIYYIFRKIIGHDRTTEGLKTLLSVLEIADVGRNDLLRGTISRSFSHFRTTAVLIPSATLRQISA
jgi:predicted nucleic acid-binding protein